MKKNQLWLGLKLAIYIQSQFGSRQKEKGACLPKGYKLIFHRKDSQIIQEGKSF